MRDWNFYKPVSGLLLSKYNCLTCLFVLIICSYLTGNSIFIRFSMTVMVQIASIQSSLKIGNFRICSEATCCFFTRSVSSCTLTRKNDFMCLSLSSVYLRPLLGLLLLSSDVKFGTLEKVRKSRLIPFHRHKLLWLSLCISKSFVHTYTFFGILF